MRLKSLTSFPTGGFVYTQPETGWRSQFGQTFEETIAAVQRHRRANPRFQFSTDLQVIAKEVEEQICARLSRTPGAQGFIVGNEAPFPQAPVEPGHQATPAPKSTAVAAIRNASAGVGALLDWLGDGMKPVDQELADRRAGVCAVCPMNGRGNLLQRLEAKGAELLRQQIEIHREMKLTTPNGGKLQTCLACDCWTPLKVWVPFSHIEAHTRPDIWEKLNPSCWMVSERAKAVTPIVVE